ncbi:uncharacterized protein ARMOST_22274 [Armillaria ostoyae]|uniref:Uncharacterized protein n=1 Tax=Armillaria ostoyae TaxID=47428 RepID=A0A284SCE8_ARMOS|nr:uncharacterized protein ARMOST_22274 [Armillaria ostoyae]
MLNNLDLSQQSVKKEKSVVKTVKTMVLSQYNLQNQQKLGIG